MLFAVLFLAHSILVGWALTGLLKLKELLLNLASAVVLGVLVNGFLVLVFSWLLGELSLIPILLSLIVSSVLLFYLKKFLTRTHDLNVIHLASVLFFFVIVGFFALNAFQLSNNEIKTVPNVYSDYSFHLSVLSSFVSGQGFPPSYLIIDEPLSYPFFFDFFSAILNYLGLDLVSSIVIPNLMLVFSLIVLLFFVAKKYSNEKTAIIFLALFLFFSSFASINLANDLASGSMQFKDYTNDGDNGLRLINFATSLLIPQRHFLLGASMVLLLLLLLASEHKTKESLIVSGLVFALLPLSHTSSFIVAGGLVAWLFFLKPSKQWFWFVLPCVLIIPQALWLLGTHSPESLIGFQPGWLTSNVSDFVLFWLKNGWIVLVLGVAGLFLSSKEARLVFIPFLAWFVLANVFRLQTWDWDNTKYFFYAFLALSFFAAVFLQKMFSIKPKLRYSAIAAVLLLLGVIAGFHALFSYSLIESNHYSIYSQKDFQTAEWIKANTPKDSVFLTGRQHNNLVYALAGRSVVLGFDGWVWSHGFQYQELIQQIRSSSNCGEFKQLGVDYLVYDSNYLSAYSSIQDFTGFKKVLDDPLIYALEC